MRVATLATCRFPQGLPQLSTLKFDHRLTQISGSGYESPWFDFFPECFTHEEGKGWRRVNVGAELPTSSSQLQSPSIEESSIGNRLKSRNGKKSGSSTPEDEIGSGDAIADDASPARSHVELVKTTCGDNHNLGLDASGIPYREVQLNFTTEI